MQITVFLVANGENQADRWGNKPQSIKDQIMTIQSFTHLLFSFEGRVRRRDFWVYFLVMWLITPVAFGSFIGFGDHRVSMPGGLFYSLIAFAILWSNLAVLTKRWHDREKSGWWSLIALIPVIGGIWLLIECGFLEGSFGNNKYGASPKPVEGGVSAV
jgi:uncharacterized membrane protein YhaH (DUF805 family)